jgi:Zn-dependent protease
MSAFDAVFLSASPIPSIIRSWILHRRCPAEGFLVRPPLSRYSHKSTDYVSTSILLLDFNGSLECSNRPRMVAGMDWIYTVSIWLLPALIAITFHEAAHGYVARFLGDDTASRLGRVSLNPVRHIDPFGTIILPGLLLIARSPFLFGYAKPVPVNFRALHPPRIGMVLVAAAGPVMNIGLAIVAALAFPLVVYLPTVAAQWAALNLKNALIINVVLAIFNLFPLPPLDGGRIVVGLLPNVLAKKFARIEPYGLMILIGLLIILPLLGSQLGIDLNFVSYLISVATNAVIRTILRLTGNI